MNRLLALIGMAVLAGCGPQKSGDAPTSQAPGPVASSVGGGRQASPDSIPAELRHEAFEYYGLANTKPVDLEANIQGQVQTGARTTKFLGIKDGAATFEVAHTGDLSKLGTYTYSVTKDGIYAIALNSGKIEPNPNLEAPASLPPGKTWGGDITVTLDAGQVVKSTQQTKVVGLEKVKTKAGEFEALLLVNTAKSTVQGIKSDDKLRAWFVKGIGPVKMEITRKTAAGTTKQVIEAVKTG